MVRDHGVTDTAQNLASTIGDFASKFTQDKDSLIGKAIKGIAGGAEAVAGFAKDLVTPGGLSGISKQKFDYLDTSVYSQGNPDDRYTVIYLPMPKGQLVDSHSHSINGVGMNPMLPLMGLAAGIIDAIVPGSGTGGAITLTDNSNYVTSVQFTEAGRVFQLITGSSGVISAGALNANGYSANSGSYGFGNP